MATSNGAHGLCTRPLSVLLVGGAGLLLSSVVALAQTAPTPRPAAPSMQAIPAPAARPPTSPVSSPTMFPPCTQEDNQAFLRSSPRPDADWVYGAAEATTVAGAYDLAISDAMKTLEVRLRGEETVFEREMKRNGVVQQDASVEQHVRVQVEQRKAGCGRETVCLAPNRAIRVRARCPRYSEMELNLRKVAEKLASALPQSATVMVLPPTDDGDNYTHLGYQAQGILQQRLQAPLLSPTQKQFIPGRSLADNPPRLQSPSKLWRERGVTHFVVGETSTASGRQVEFRLQLQLAATEEVLPQSMSRFELTLEPQEQEKLAIKGALFPQKASMDLAAALGNRGGVEVRLSSTKLREGENVEISVRIAEPAYVYIFDIYENGKASLLLPSPALRNNHLEAGRWYTFPDDSWRQAGYQLKACPIPGDKINRERIKVIATSKPLELPLDRFSLEDLADLREGPKGQIAEINQRLAELQRAGAGIATAVAAYDITASPKRNTGCPKQ